MYTEPSGKRSANRARSERPINGTIRDTVHLRECVCTIHTCLMADYKPCCKFFVGQFIPQTRVCIMVHAANVMASSILDSPDLRYLIGHESDFSYAFLSKLFTVCQQHVFLFTKFELRKITALVYFYLLCK